MSTFLGKTFIGNNLLPASPLSQSFAALKKSLPCPLSQTQKMANCFGQVVYSNMKPLWNERAQHGFVKTKVWQYTMYLKTRAPGKRLSTTTRPLRGFSYFATARQREATAKLVELEEDIERTVFSHRALRLTEDEIKQNPSEAIRVLEKCVGRLTAQGERIYQFQMDLNAWERYSRDPKKWSLPLHRRIHRLNEQLNIILTGVNVIQWEIGNGRDIKESLNALAMTRNHSLNPLEYIRQMYKRFDRPCNIVVADLPTTVVFTHHLVVREILVHLMENAIRNGAKTIEIAIPNIDDQQVVVSVADDCPGGIPESFRPDIGKKPIEHGDGIGGRGLWIVCQQLLPQMMGATISFNTGKNGTRFTLTVPIQCRSSSSALRFEPA